MTPEAIREYNRSYYQTHKDEKKARARKNYHADIEKSRQVRREYAKRASLKIYGQKIAKKYQISLEQYDTMLAAQGGKCKLCESPEPGGPGKRFHVDHDHKTNEVRGLLCNACNLGLGKFKDDPVLLVKAAEYLKETRGHAL